MIYQPPVGFVGIDTFTYTAQDASGNRTVSTVTIQVESGYPTDISLSSSSVPENQPVGTVVGMFSASDPDVGDTHTFALVSGAGSTDNASFTIAGSALETAAVFNYETKASYSIRVRATDQIGLGVEKPFTITVTAVAADSSLVAAWNFNEGSGAIAHDVSGHGNDVMLYGATWVDGKFGKALSFSGFNDYAKHRGQF